MIDLKTKREIGKKLAKAREKMYLQFPLWGTLLMHLRFELDEVTCETAYTDMKKIAFHPDFVLKLSEKELLFVLNHEILHIVLEHCIRGKERNPVLYNYACDIWINSYLMHLMGVTEFAVAESEVLHQTPDGEEGYLFDADTLYKKLLEYVEQNGAEVLLKMQDALSGIDSHEAWEQIEIYSALSDQWKKKIKEEILKHLGSLEDCPSILRELDEKYRYKPRIRWKLILRDFIRKYEVKQDFHFHPPDRRPNEYGLILPGLNETEEPFYKDILFFFDASGSISDYELKIFFEEVKQIYRQVQEFHGELAFFDTKVIPPVPFDSVRTLEKIKPIGGGGTNFHAVFEYVKENRKRNPPAAVVILTDGYAAYPDKKAANGIPVLWVIVPGGIKAPWGKCICINE